jgi:hypothetical protein
MEAARPPPPGPPPPPRPRPRPRRPCPGSRPRRGSRAGHDRQSRPAPAVPSPMSRPVILSPSSSSPALPSTLCIDPLPSAHPMRIHICRARSSSAPHINPRASSVPPSIVAKIRGGVETPGPVVSRARRGAPIWDATGSQGAHTHSSGASACS